VSHGSLERHLEPGEVAAYVDGAVEGPARRAIESHLAACAQCRSEVTEVGGVIRSIPRARRARVWFPAVAAAAAVLIWWVAPAVDPAPPAVIHRDEAVTATSAPRLLPGRSAGAAPMATWSPVPSADRYRVRLFDATGAVLWERETVDTIAIVPDSVALKAGTPYYWKVESHSGFGRWTGSDLLEFIPQNGRGP
jgi:anti-sigma factor RsiW